MLTQVSEKEDLRVYFGSVISIIIVVGRKKRWVWVLVIEKIRLQSILSPCFRLEVNTNSLCNQNPNTAINGYSTLFPTPRPKCTVWRTELPLTLKVAIERTEPNTLWFRRGISKQHRQKKNIRPKLGVVVLACHPSIQKVEVEGSEVQSHLHLHRDFGIQWTPSQKRKKKIYYPKIYFKILFSPSFKIHLQTSPYTGPAWW